MKADEVVKMFRHYRHDLLNDLQIVNGYLSMGNMEKIKEKLTVIFEKTKEERKLMNLNCPHFILWLMNFNSTYPNFRIQFTVTVEHRDFSSIDLSLYATCQEIVQFLHNHISNEKLYNGELIVYESEGQKVKLSFNGPFIDKEKVRTELEKKHFVQTVVLDEEHLEIILHLS